MAAHALPPLSAREAASLSLRHAACCHVTLSASPLANLVSLQMRHYNRLKSDGTVCCGMHGLLNRFPRRCSPSAANLPRRPTRAG
eukprot:2856196-Pleurochrysis_carterae.AAC.1